MRLPGLSTTSERPPAVTWVYGLLGLLPFLAGAAAAALTAGELRAVAQIDLLAYGALILSFLGGARWGLEIDRRPVRPAVIGASMTPTIFAFLVLIALGVATWLRLVLMSTAFLAQWAWDVRSKDPPSWYPRLRHVLTAGAVGCMLIAAVASA